MTSFLLNIQILPSTDLLVSAGGMTTDNQRTKAKPRETGFGRR
jgi:hypothetical protein